VSIELIIESAPPSWILVGSLLEMLSKSRPHMIPSLTVVHMRHRLPNVRSWRRITGPCLCTGMRNGIPFCGCILIIIDTRRRSSDLL
jgi:hypothetical protein